MQEAQLRREEEEYRKLEAKYREELGIDDDDLADSDTLIGSELAPEKELTPRGENELEVEVEGVNVEVPGEEKL